MRGDKRAESSTLNYKPKQFPDAKTRKKTYNSVPTFSLGQKKNCIHLSVDKVGKPRSVPRSFPAHPHTLMHLDASFI